MCMPDMFFFTISCFWHELFLSSGRVMTFLLVQVCLQDILSLLRGQMNTHDDFVTVKVSNYANPT